MSTMTTLLKDDVHELAVETVSCRLQQFYKSQTPFRVYHGSTNSTRASPYRANNIVDISRMNRILAVDVPNKLVYAEPNVPMDKLVTETLKHGLMPAVVMEFPGITVGGGFSGTSGESSSFRHGFFHDTVKTIEMVLGDGEAVIASEYTRPDLFRGAASSLGTLGVVTLLAIELIVAKPYVELTYVRTNSIEQTLKIVEEQQQDSQLDYLDGMFFSKNHGVVCLGHLSDGQAFGSHQITTFSWPWDKWFYINAEDRSKEEVTWTEVIPVKDYLFRYDRGAFWMGKYTYRYFGIPCTRLTRWLLDSYSRTRVMYQALHRSELSDSYVVQDVAIPYRSAPRFHSYLDKEFPNYPIWVCPLKLQESGEPSGQPVGRMLNFGVWGPGPSNHIVECKEWNRNLERVISELGGWKWLYAQTFYTETEFWSSSIFDKRECDSLRVKYRAKHLPTIYDKIKTSASDDSISADRSWVAWLIALIWATWPIKGLYGWLQCIIADEYLLPRKRTGQ